MFENLTDRLESVFKKLRGHGTLTEENIQDAMREVRTALLEADVNLAVVKDFIASVTEKAIGQEVLISLSPGQQVIKIVHNELVELLGQQAVPLQLGGQQPAIIMLAGLQGSGKTTTLYSVLKSLNDEDVNITTIEDPIEIKLEGINQSQINAKAGITFASCMRAILRQDPDIILVGEQLIDRRNIVLLYFCFRETWYITFYCAMIFMIAAPDYAAILVRRMPYL